MYEFNKTYKPNELPLVILHFNDTINTTVEHKILCIISIDCRSKFHDNHTYYDLLKTFDLKTCIFKFIY